MIGKLNKKDIIALSYITILSLIAVMYGFSIIPSPAKEQVIAIDARRVSDLSNIQTTVDNYYQTHSMLPPTLDELKSQAYSPSTPLDKTDPQTNKPYEYTVMSAYSYQLCATFATDSTKDQLDPNDATSVSYPAYNGDFTHPQGHFCFTEKEQPPYNGPITHPSIFPCRAGVMCPLSETKSPSSPSAIFSSFVDNGSCAWTPTFYIKGFEPYSQITVSSVDILSNECTKKPNQKETSSTMLNLETSGDGNALVAFPEQLVYGEYTFTFTDNQGQSASVHLTYDGKSLRPTIIPSDSH